MFVKIFDSTRSIQVHIAYRSYCSHVLGQRRKRSRSKTEERAVESAHPGTSREVYLDSEGQAGRQAGKADGKAKNKSNALLFGGTAFAAAPALAQRVKAYARDPGRLAFTAVQALLLIGPSSGQTWVRLFALRDAVGRR